MSSEEWKENLDLKLGRRRTCDTTLYLSMVPSVAVIPKRGVCLPSAGRDSGRQGNELPLGEKPRHGTGTWGEVLSRDALPVAWGQRQGEGRFLSAITKVSYYS